MSSATQVGSRSLLKEAPHVVVAVRDHGAWNEILQDQVRNGEELTSVVVRPILRADSLSVDDLDVLVDSKWERD